MKPYQKTDKRRNNQILKLRKQGKTLQEIGDTFDLTRSGVAKLLKKLSTQKLVDNGSKI